MAKIVFVFLMGAFIGGASGYKSGYGDAKREAQVAADKVDDAMVRMGFCEWTRKVRRQQKCWPEQVMSSEPRP